MTITGKSREDASIILHDHNNDLAAAVNAAFEGEAESNLDTWQERTKKKKTKAKV